MNIIYHNHSVKIDMPTYRTRNITEIDIKYMREYVMHGFYDPTIDNPLLDEIDTKKYDALLDNLLFCFESGDIRLVAIDKCSHIMDIRLHNIPDDLELLYKLLDNGKVKLGSYLLDDSKLDISRIGPDHIYGSLDFNESLLKYKDNMVHRIRNNDDILIASRAKELNIPIEICIHDPEDRENYVGINEYMELVSELHKIDIHISEPNIKEIVTLTAVSNPSHILSLLDMGYKLDDVTDLDLDVKDTNTYNRLHKFMSKKHIIYYFLASRDELNTIPHTDGQLYMYLNEPDIIHYYHTRDDIMSITSPSYHLRDCCDYDSNDLYIIHKSRYSITNMRHMITLLNDHDIIIKSTEINRINTHVAPLDRKMYRTGIIRLWKQVSHIPKIVKYYLTNYISLVPILEPRIIPTKFYSYDGYANIKRILLTSDINITCI